MDPCQDVYHSVILPQNMRGWIISPSKVEFPDVPGDRILSTRVLTSNIRIDRARKGQGGSTVRGST